MKIVSLRKLDGLEADLINTFPDITFVFTNGIDDITDKDKQSVDVLVGYDGSLDQVFLEACPKLKWLAWYSTGVNKLPLDYIAKRNIILTNGKGVHAKQMSEFIIAYILDDYKLMRTSYINQQNKLYDSRMVGRRVSNESILFLGTGSIATSTAHIAKALGMEIIGVNTSGRNVNGFDKTYSIKELTDILPEADIIVNTLPETESTIHLLSRKHFEVMKATSLFINVGRGTLIEESVLIDVLKNKIIRHAYLDVFEKEPLTPDNELYLLDNVTITAHITGNGIENNREATEIFIENLKHFLNNGDVIENKVNLEQGY